MNRTLLLNKRQYRSRGKMLTYPFLCVAIITAFRVLTGSADQEWGSIECTKGKLTPSLDNTSDGGGGGDISTKHVAGTSLHLTLSSDLARRMEINSFILVATRRRQMVSLCWAEGLSFYLLGEDIFWVGSNNSCKTTSRYCYLIRRLMVLKKRH